MATKRRITKEEVIDALNNSAIMNFDCDYENIRMSPRQVQNGSKLIVGELRDDDGDLDVVVVIGEYAYLIQRGFQEEGFQEAVREAWRR